MAGRVGRNLFLLGPENERLPLRRRTEEICRSSPAPPTASDVQQEYDTNYSSSKDNSFHLGVTSKGKETKVVVIAGSVNGEAEAEAAYRRLASGYSTLLKESAEYYRAYLDSTVSVDLPDRELQQSYDWARVSVLQGLATNPFLGTGLIAGYRTSGGSQRPGFAWFFGRDALWTSLALDAEGDFANTRVALDFLSKYQRADGKMPHEISQGASFVPWFTDYPYPYASADATPLYIITMNDYVVSSGDVAFAREKWDSVWKAYQFLISTYDAQGLPQNFGIGHGWVEGGPLLPVHTELYQSALGAEALRALSSLARLTGKEDVGKKLGEDFSRQQPLVNKTFWSAEKKRFAFALDTQNQQVDEPSVLATVPMWFGLLDDDKAGAMITELAAPEHEADWGMRIISSRAAKYSAGGYHFGSVWPLFTGWASVGEYRYHRALPGFSNLKANAQLALDGSLGHVTEVLSGDYYQPISTSSPHQIWSAAMVVSPLLRGMFGLQTNAGACQVTLAPHVPADWTWFTLDHVRAASASLRLAYRKTTQRYFSDHYPRRKRRLHTGIFSRRQPKSPDSRGRDERPASSVPDQEERRGSARRREISRHCRRKCSAHSPQKRLRALTLTRVTAAGKHEPGPARAVRIMDACAGRAYPRNYRGPRQAL